MKKSPFNIRRRDSNSQLSDYDQGTRPFKANFGARIEVLSSGCGSVGREGSSGQVISKILKLTYFLLTVKKSKIKKKRPRKAIKMNWRIFFFGLFVFSFHCQYLVNLPFGHFGSTSSSSVLFIERFGVKDGHFRGHCSLRLCIVHDPWDQYYQPLLAQYRYSYMGTRTLGMSYFLLKK